MNKQGSKWLALGFMLGLTSASFGFSLTFEHMTMPNKLVPGLFVVALGIGLWHIIAKLYATSQE